MLYHYCDRLTGADIVRDGVIRASPLILHDDVLGLDRGIETPPIVWLTVSSAVDPTVAWKVLAAGWPLKPGDIHRIVVPEDYQCETLDDWSDRVGIPPSRWRWVIATAKLVGSSWEDWRIVDHDIPTTDWAGVETDVPIGR